MIVSMTERQTVYQQLRQWIKTDLRRVAVLADLVMAIPLSRSLPSQDLAANILREVQDQSIAQMLRRFYKNEAVTWVTMYWPLLEPFLAHLEGAAYYLIMDTTEIGHGYRALVLSLAYQHRSIPLIWRVEAGAKGHTSEQVQIDLLTQFGRYFQPDRPVIFWGDSEFDGVKLQRHLTDQGWYYVCRTSPALYIYPAGPAEGFPLADLVPEPDRPAQHLDQVEFTTKHRYGPLTCWAGWETPHADPLIRLAHLPPGWSPRPTYQPRFWTEPLFGDCKEGGFRLNTSRLRHPDRLSRLFLAVALAYLWMVCLGAQVIADGLANWVDRSNRRTLSLFKTGWRWFKRQIKFGATVLIYLKLPTDFVLPPLKYT
jgi:hypothetical protein